MDIYLCTMKQYTIHPGRQNFTPSEPPWPRLGPGFTFEAVFHHSCYWSWADWGFDRDWYDWNKLTGQTWFFSPNNHTSALVAWRPANLKGKIQVAPYLNYPGSVWKVGDTLTVDTQDNEHGSRLTGSVYAGKREVIYRMAYEEQRLEMVFPWKRKWPWITRQVGTWIGGGNDKEGPYGGEATQEMKLWLGYKQK